MKRFPLCSSLLILIVASSAIPSFAQKKITLPTGRPPVFGVARLKPNGILEFEAIVIVPITEKRARTVIKNGKKVVGNYTTVVYHKRTVTNLKKLSEVEFYRGTGEKLLIEDIRDELEKPQVVVMTTDGKKLDPFYRAVLNPNVLVVVKKIRKPAGKKK